MWISRQANFGISGFDNYIEARHIHHYRTLNFPCFTWKIYDAGVIRIIHCRSAAQAKDYHANALSQGDYFINDQDELAWRFYGRIAERLGIYGPVTKEAYDALCENLHPLTGSLLTSRKLDNQMTGYDINFHCPKSVSIVSPRWTTSCRSSCLEIILQENSYGKKWINPRTNVCEHSFLANNRSFSKAMVQATGDSLSCFPLLVSHIPGRTSGTG